MEHVHTHIVKACAGRGGGEMCYMLMHKPQCTANSTGSRSRRHLSETTHLSYICARYTYFTDTRTRATPCPRQTHTPPYIYYITGAPIRCAMGAHKNVGPQSPISMGPTVWAFIHVNALCSSVRSTQYAQYTCTIRRLDLAVLLSAVWVRRRCGRRQEDGKKEGGSAEHALRPHGLAQQRHRQQRRPERL